MKMGVAQLIPKDLRAWHLVTLPSLCGGLSGPFGLPGELQGQVTCLAGICSDICMNAFLL